MPQFRALVVVSTHPGTAVSDLAAALDIHPTTATRLTDRLVAKRLVRRSIAADDRRVTRLHLTAAGARLVQRVTVRRSREITRVVDRMSPATLPEITAALGAFAAAACESDDVDLFGWDVPGT